MKKEKLSKRLFLNKATIADLEGKAMTRVLGGGTKAGATCEFTQCPIDECDTMVSICPPFITCPLPC